jgi:SAM-dependent methyltransferase
LVAPPEVIAARQVSTLAEQSLWENALIGFFSSHWQSFTPFVDYFRVRGLEFRALRQLLAPLFGLQNRYKRGLELGCGYGFVSAILSPFVNDLLGTDIPEKYAGYVRGDFANSTEVSRQVVCDCLKVRNARFEAAWPHTLPCEDREIDFALSMYVLEHIPDLQATARELARVMCAGGVAIHVVPSTVDMFFAYTRAQLGARYKDVVKARVKRLIGRRTPHTGTGAVQPELHSEFARSFEHQLEIYSLESYMFPFIENGFSIEQVTMTREHNRVLVFRRLD